MVHITAHLRLVMRVPFVRLGRIVQVARRIKSRVHVAHTQTQQGKVPVRRVAQERPQAAQDKPAVMQHVQTIIAMIIHGRRHHGRQILLPTYVKLVIVRLVQSTAQRLIHIIRALVQLVAVAHIWPAAPIPIQVVRHVRQRRGGQQRPAVQVRPPIPHVIRHKHRQIAQVVQLNVPPAA